MLDFLKKTSEKKENFWALLIEPEWITSSIWQITDGKVEIISTSPATRWETDLIGPIDTSLSSCTQNLPEDIIDPTKTVFGVPNSWIDNGNIKEEYLEKLKKICEDLSLVPSGFVVLSEAISHFIKQEEEVALSGIVVGISNETLDLSIFDTGKLIGTTSVMRSISVEEDMVEGISRLTGEFLNLPSRIILFNEKKEELEEIKNSLNDADWNKVKFMHPPKIEILDPSKKILAVVLAGGSELGADTITEDMPLEEVNKFASYEVNNVEEPEGVTAEDLGFTVGTHTVPVVQEAVYVPHVFKLPTVPKFTNVVKRFAFFKKPNFSIGSKPLIMGGVMILTLIFVGFVLWWFLPKATVTIFVVPKKLEENILISIGGDIKGESVDVNVSGEKTKSTTGTKTVGDKAKGTVKIQNGTAFPINLPSGTVLVSSSDLKFVTTKSASVSGALSPSSPGIATVDIEAGSIGSEFNLGKDEVFKIGNYPKAEADATAVDTFSGGSSRQISSVSEDDRKKLLDDLKKELVEEAKLKLNEKITEGMMLVEASFKDEVEEEDFSNKTGDEATNLKLNLSLKITSTVVSKLDLINISKKNLEGKIPSGFVLRDDQMTYDFGTSGEEDQFEVKVSVNLLPSIDVVSIAKQIAGKYPKMAENFLSTVPGFVNAEIRLKPTLIGKLGTLPHISKNINVEITSEK